MIFCWVLKDYGRDYAKRRAIKVSRSFFRAKDTATVRDLFISTILSPSFSLWLSTRFHLLEVLVESFLSLSLSTSLSKHEYSSRRMTRNKEKESRGVSLPVCFIISNVHASLKVELSMAVRRPLPFLSLVYTSIRYWQEAFHNFASFHFFTHVFCLSSLFLGVDESSKLLIRDFSIENQRRRERGLSLRSSAIFRWLDGWCGWHYGLASDTHERLSHRCAETSINRCPRFKGVYRHIDAFITDADAYNFFLFNRERWKNLASFYCFKSSLVGEL